MLLFQLFQLVNSQAFGSEGNCDTNADCNAITECLNGVCYPTNFMYSPCGIACDDGYQCVNNRCQPTAALCSKCKPNFYCVADVCAAKVDRCSSFQGICGDKMYCGHLTDVCTKYDSNHCKYDSDCVYSNMACTNNTCIDKTTNCNQFSNACGDSQFCNTTTSKCQDYGKDHCGKDSDCQHCDFGCDSYNPYGCLNNTCLLKNESCTLFTNVCGQGFGCVNQTNQCTAFSDSFCIESANCASGKGCHRGKCFSLQDNCNLFTDACGPGAKCVIGKCANLFILTWYNFYIPVGIGFFGIGNVLQKVFENAKLKQKWKRKRDELKKKTKDNK